MSLRSKIGYWENQLRYARNYNDCNRALLTAGVPEKTMEPKTNENAAIAVLEEKLAYHKKNITTMATYVASHETSTKAVKQIEAALKKLG